MPGKDKVVRLEEQVRTLTLALHASMLELQAENGARAALAGTENLLEKAREEARDAVREVARVKASEEEAGDTARRLLEQVREVMGENEDLRVARDEAYVAIQGLEAAADRVRADGEERGRQTASDEMERLLLERASLARRVGDLEAALSLVAQHGAVDVLAGIRSPSALRAIQEESTGGSPVDFAFSPLGVERWRNEAEQVLPPQGSPHRTAGNGMEAALLREGPLSGGSGGGGATWQGPHSGGSGGRTHSG
ncbi:hypothetical protein T484DRAFT_1906852, partial [Baffinella frigidus]